MTVPSEGSHAPLRLLVTQNSFSYSLCTKPQMHHTPSQVWCKWSITEQYCPHVFGCMSALEMRYSWRTCIESVGFPNPHNTTHNNTTKGFFTLICYSQIWPEETERGKTPCSSVHRDICRAESIWSQLWRWLLQGGHLLAEPGTFVSLQIKGLREAARF